MSNNEQQRITCAYGFDKLTPEQKKEFQDFLMYLKKNDLYPKLSQEAKDRVWKKVRPKNDR